MQELVLVLYVPVSIFLKNLNMIFLYFGVLPYHLNISYLKMHILYTVSLISERRVSYPSKDVIILLSYFEMNAFLIQILFTPYLLEEEVISNELILSVLVHAFERVELTLEVSLEGLKSGDDLVHNLESLLLSESGSKREVSEVTADSDTGGNNHGSIFGGEGRGLELAGVHVRDMLCALAMLVIVQDDLVEEGSEGSVGIVGASVDTNT